MTARKRSDLKTLGTCSAVFEVVTGMKTGEPGISIVVSMPGREGTFTRSWGAFGRALDASEADDLHCWLNVTLRHLLLARHGIQMLLPMG